MDTRSIRPILALATLALAACQSAPEPQPAPAPQPVEVAPQPAPATGAVGAAVMDPNVVVVPPAKGVPAAYAAFSGMWSGTLDGLYPGKLAVLTVSPKGAVTVTYAWGSVADNRPGIADGHGRINGGRMTIARLPNGADMVFTMQPDGTLAASYALAGQTYQGVFTRG